MYDGLCRLENFLIFLHIRNFGQHENKTAIEREKII